MTNFEAEDVAEDPKQQSNSSVERTAENIGDEANSADLMLEQYALRRARFLVRKMNIPSDVAEDLRQKALLRYYQLTKEQRDRIKNHQAYLYKMIKNEASDYIREQKPHITTQLETAEINSVVFQTPDNYKSIEIHILLEEIWSQLEGDERLLFELLIWGYEGKELAFRLEISEDAARQRTSRLRSKLKAMLTKPRRSPTPSGGR